MLLTLARDMHINMQEGRKPEEIQIKFQMRKQNSTGDRNANFKLEY